MLTIDIHLQRKDFQLRIHEQLGLTGVTGIMGPSGCGKTTLLRCLAGLEKAENSHICFTGQQWQSAQIFLPPEQRRIGYIFQDGRLFPHLSVQGNLGFAQKRGQKRRSPTANHAPDEADIIDWLGITPLLERRVDTLSGGQRQRVAIARALMMAPQLLLMDEPLAALDWQAKASIIPRLRELRARFHIPVIFVSHDREEMARLADELLLLDHGTVQQRGALGTLLSQGDGMLADSYALSVLEGGVTGWDEYGMTVLNIEGRRLVLDRDNLLAGQRIRIVIPAAEVSIALADSYQISIQNRLQATVTALRSIDKHHTLVQLRLDHQTFQALITQRACQQLQLVEGMVVYAHFKATSLALVQ